MSDEIIQDDEGPLLSIEEAAKYLEVSVAEIRRKQRQGDLTPVRRRGHKGRLFFRLSDVEQAAEIRQSRYEYTTEQAAVVFSALEEGLTPIQATIQKKIPPNAVRAILPAYAELKGGIYLPTETLRLLHKLDLDGPVPMTSAEDVVGVMKTMVETSKKVKCAECNKHPRLFCKACVNEYAERKVAEATGTADL